MRYFFTLVLLLSSINLAQIPNSSFESWTAGNPDGWITTNIFGLVANVTQVNDAHHGSSAARGEVVSIENGAFPPLLLTLAELNSRPASLTGYYKFTPVQGDEFIVVVGMLKDSVMVGEGIYQSDDTKSSYSHFTVDINYISPETPDMVLIQVFVTGSDDEDEPHAGTFYIVDHFEFSNLTGNNDENLVYSYNLNQNYPNPFNPSTIISYQLPREEFVTIKIYDIIGNEVATLVNNVKQAGDHQINFDASGLTNGVYIYSIKAGSFQQTRKMMLIK
jgi:hypothetical protein